MMSHKRPKTDRRIEIPKGKIPRVATPPNDHLLLKWCFTTFDNYRWSSANYNDDDFNDIAKHLQSYQRMTWADVKRRDHPIEVSKIIYNAQKQLAVIKQEDIDMLWRVAFKGLQRIWGIRENEYFRVLWWDPEHKIYPTKKKHT